MERGRLGQLLAAAGAVALVVALLVVGATSMVLSPSRASAATAELLAVDDIHDEVVAVLAAELPGLYEPGRVTPDAAVVVAERMVRDGAFVASAADAVDAAHHRWRAGEPYQLVLPSAAVVPVAAAAFRDVDLELSRDFPEGAVLRIAPIGLDVEPAATASGARSVGLVLLVAGLALMLVGSVIDRRSDRALHEAAIACFLVALIVGGLGVVAWTVDLSDRGVVLGFFAALVTVTRTPIVVMAGLSGLLALFLWASASQVAPLVAAREERRTRRLAGPEVAASGAQRARWWRGRSVRQQAIDAFFDPDADADPDAEAGPSAHGVAAETGDPGRRPLAGRGTDGFDDAIAAVEADPDGAGPDDGDDRDAGTSGEAAAADRREALERIDGARSRLRTHLPR